MRNGSKLGLFYWTKNMNNLDNFMVVRGESAWVKAYWLVYFSFSMYYKYFSLIHICSLQILR